MYKVDFHTHSWASPDGNLTKDDYTKLLENNVLDYIAVTDHNTVQAAIELNNAFGDRIIIGKEIMTQQGEIIGLFLSADIPAGRGLLETITMIKDQGGLVYVPHPFESIRKGLSRSVLDVHTEKIDIVEIHNARAFFQNLGPQAATWAKFHHKVMAASSDAHGKKGIGTTYTVLTDKPASHNLVELLAKAHFVTDRPPLSSLLYPKLNRLRKKIGRSQ